jgi:hypothetical protein
MAVGLLKEGINEVIATTIGNAAPIGVHFREGKTSMVLFLGSHTAANIEREGRVVANIIHDPVMYVKTAFEDLPAPSFTEEPVIGGIVHRLSAADAWAAFTTRIEHKSPETMVISLTLEKEIIEQAGVYPVNRGFNSIIDATVHATRYVMTRDPDLKKIIDYHSSLVQKCGGNRELEALGLLLDYIR